MIVVNPKSGISIEKMPFEDYCALEEINQSFIKTLINKSPLHAKLGMKEESSAMSMGTLAHSIMFDELDPHKDLAPYAGTRRGKNWDAFKSDSIASGKQPVTVKEHESCVSMKESIPDYIGTMIDGTAKETTILFEMLDVDSGMTIKAKARIDILDSSMIADYKTTSKGISVKDFKSSIGKYYYDLQAAWYRMAVYALTGYELPFYWIAQETSSPYDINVFEASEELLSNGKDFMNFGIQRYCQCLADDDFHGHFKGSPVEIDVPDWHLFESPLDTTGVKEQDTL